MDSWLVLWISDVAFLDGVFWIRPLLGILLLGDGLLICWELATSLFCGTVVGWSRLVSAGYSRSLEAEKPLEAEKLEAKRFGKRKTLFKHHS